MRRDRIIVDANIAFRCLIAHRGDLRVQMLQQSGTGLFTPRYLFVELFKHKQRIVTASKLAEDEVLEALYTLSSQLRFYNESLIPLPVWVEAVRLCGSIDEKDTPYVALTVHLDGRLWTQDEVLKKGLLAKGFDRFFEP